MKFSIIIPIYNAERYLDFCLKSISSQTFKDFEVLLVDDGSVDSSSDICASYVNKDERFIYLKKENGGSFQTRLYGVEHAKGDYIMFCDSDDYYCSKNMLKILNKVISETACDLIQFSHKIKYNHLFKKHCIQDKKIVYEDEFQQNDYTRLLRGVDNKSALSTSMCNKVYNRKLIYNLPSSSDANRIFWGDDLITNIYMLQNCKVTVFMPEIFYVYRYSSGGTKKFNINTMRDLDNIKKIQLEFLEKLEILDKNSIRASTFAEIAAWFYLYICDAIKILDESEVLQLITNALNFSSFKIARNYYLNESTEHWEAVDLLRVGDPQKYIAAAKKHISEKSTKQKIADMLKKIYTHI